MTRPCTSLGSFVRYINATPEGRGPVAAQLQAPIPWTLARDYWLPMRNAVRKDLSTSRDGTHPLAVAATANPKKFDNYHQVASAWKDLTPHWNGGVRHPRTTRKIEIGGLEISVRPTLIDQRSSGELEVVLVWFAKNELSVPVETTTRWLMAHAFPGAISTIVDLRRRTVTSSPLPTHMEYDSWLTSEAAGLAHLLTIKE